MKKIICTVMAVACSAISALAGSAENIQKQLEASIEAGNPAAAAQWATALSQVRQAELMAEYTKTAKSGNAVINTYGNFIKSAPALLNGLEFYNKLQKHPDTELADVIDVIRTLLKLIERPLNDQDIQPVVQKIDAEEKKRMAEWQKSRSSVQKRWDEYK